MPKSTRARKNSELHRLKQALDGLEWRATDLSNAPGEEPLKIIIDKPLSELIFPDREPELRLIWTGPVGEIDGSGI